MEPHGTPVVKTSELVTVGENGELITETTTTETRQILKNKAVDVVVEEIVAEVEQDTVTEEADLDVVALCRDIASNAEFVALDLSGAQLTTDDIVHMAEALRLNTTLEKLALDDNEIQDDGLKEIARTLRINKTLDELTIGAQATVTSDEVQRLLAEAVDTNPTIRIFAFTFTDETSRITVERALARNETAYIASRTRKVVKTINVQEVEEITTVRKDKKIVDGSEVDVSVEIEAEAKQGDEVDVVEVVEAPIAVATPIATPVAIAVLENKGLLAVEAVAATSEADATSEYVMVESATKPAETKTVEPASAGKALETSTNHVSEAAQVVESIHVVDTSNVVEVMESSAYADAAPVITSEKVAESKHELLVIDEKKTKAAEDVIAPPIVAAAPVDVVNNSVGEENLREIVVEETVAEAAVEGTMAETAIEKTVAETAVEETVTETMVEETVAETVVVETVAEEIVHETIIEKTVQETIFEETVQKAAVDEVAQETVGEGTVTETVVTEVKMEETTTVANESVVVVEAEIANAPVAVVETVLVDAQATIMEELAVDVPVTVVETISSREMVIETTATETPSAEHVTEESVYAGVDSETSVHGVVEVKALSLEAVDSNAETVAAITEVVTEEVAIAGVVETYFAATSEALLSEPKSIAYVGDDVTGGNAGLSGETVVLGTRAAEVVVTETAVVEATIVETVTDVSSLEATAETKSVAVEAVAVTSNTTTTIVTEKKANSTIMIVIVSLILLIVAVLVGILLMPTAIVVEEVIVVERVVEAAGLLFLAGAFPFTNVIVRADADVNLPSAVLPRLLDLLSTSANTTVSLVQSTNELDVKLATSINADETLVLCIGSNDCTRSLISEELASSLGSESFHIVSRKNESTPLVMAVDGVNSIDEAESQEGTMRIQKVWSHGNRGLAYGVYAALEELGFAFMHPLKPSIPPVFSLNASNLSIHEAPRWQKFRAVHYHTQHPLELTPFLQGFGPNGTDDSAGWENQIPDFASYCEWLVANRQNAVEWPLLEGHTWVEFARSDGRVERLKRIADVAHSYGIMVGLDVPIAFAQQHSFRLLKNANGKESHFEEEKAEIEASLDWIMLAGWDFLGTESGTSEFTHSSPETMLAWMNAASDYAAEKYGITMFIKIHCSAGQLAKGFIDDRTGQDINFNMLPHFASKNLGVLPHTVEAYALDDPAPTYSNKNFDEIRQYLNWELANGDRPVVFYPETAYWVSVDIDVPLFMPIYAERRLHDLRLIARDENASVSKKRMDGQLIFASGWEWGYWLNDALAARAAWNPFVEIENDADAFRALARPLTRHLNTIEDQEGAAALLVDWTKTEKDLFIYGQLEGKDPLENVERKNGHGYLEGWDTWDDVSKVLGKLTQPDRLGLVEFKHAENWLDHIKEHLLKFERRNVDVEYAEFVRPLLVEMDAKLVQLANRTASLAEKAPVYMTDLWNDMADAAVMTALRAHQILNLYEFIYDLKTEGIRNETIAAEAMASLYAAKAIVETRETQYRLDPERVAAWTGLNTPNQPTAYAFNYLWSVRSLHYWWRDAAEALGDAGLLFSCHVLHWREVNLTSQASASFANIINPVEVGLGSGLLLHVAEDVAELLSAFHVGKDYFDVAEKEPHYPQDIKNWPY
ncbi:hypothetical protein BC830DRAFT_1128868 [Chytriomyces sp. MP71]|nr:hypothetical protein BC830DRAFT_1128868 [Chytriomyces sp. MP71]